MSLLTKIVNVDWRPVRVKVINESPFTGRRQVSSLRYHRWVFRVDYALTRGADALAKRAALAALRGGDVSFDFRDPSLAIPVSGYTGTGAVNGDSTGYTITADGFSNNTSLLKAGDYFSVQIGGQWQLFSASADITTNGTGQATITTDQPIRGTALDGSTIKISDWFVTCTLEGNETFTIDKNGSLKLPPLTFIEDF